MDTRLGLERLRAGTSRAIRQGSPGDDLRGVEQLIAQGAAKEREDWERVETAKVRADAYKIAGEFQKRIEEGKLKDENGTPYDEERFVNEYRKQLQQRVDRLDPSVRSRAQADVSQHGAFMETELRGRLRNYYGQKRDAEDLKAADELGQAAINAPTDVLTGIIVDQAAMDLDRSIETTPVEKLKRISNLKRAVWGARLDARIQNPGQDIEGLRAWVDGLPVDMAARQEFRQAVDTRGREVKRAEDASYLDAQMDAYVTTPAARETILANVQTYMGGRVGNYEPGQVEAALRTFQDKASWNAFNYDMQFQGYQRVNPKAYGLSPEKLTLAADAVERAQITALQQQAYIENQREIQQSRARNQEFGAAWIQILEDMRDPNFNIGKFDQLQTKIKAAQLDGWPGGDELFTRVEGLRNEYQTRRDIATQAWGAMGTGSLSQKEADTIWQPYLRDREIIANATKERPDVTRLIADFVRESGRIPEPVVKLMEAAANNPYADQIDQNAIREQGSLYERIRREAPGAAAQVAEKARAIYEAMEYGKDGQAITGDDEIKAIIKYVHDPEAHKTKKEQWGRLEGGDKGLRKRMEKALKQGSGGLFEFDIHEDLWPGSGLAGTDMYGNELIADAIVDRAGKLYELSPSASVNKALSLAAIETFKTWGLWNDGVDTVWMEKAPTIFINDPGWLREKLNQVLEPRGYTMERYELGSLGAVGAGAAEYAERAQKLRRSQVVLQWDGEEFTNFPEYYVCIKDGYGETFLTDENNQNLKFGGEAVWKTYRNWQPGGAARREEDKQRAGKIKQQKRMDDVWKKNVQETMRGIGVY